MIARVWHGRTPISKSEAYKRFLLETAVPDYRATDGCLGLTFLHRMAGEEAHFTLVTFWPSVEAVRRFAGEDFEKAKYYPEDREFLIDYEERVVHHEVFYHQPVAAFEANT